MKRLTALLALFILCNSSAQAAISKKTYFRIIRQFEKRYKPFFKKRKIKFQISKNLWDSNTENAFAKNTRTFGIFGKKLYKINAHGGYARNKYMTPDAFALTLCHEVGHFIGGYPLKTNRSYTVSSEGQADYFASAKCIRKYFRKDNNVEIVDSKKVDPFVNNRCHQAFSFSEDIAICIRTAIAAFEKTNLLLDRRKRMAGNKGKKFASLSFSKQSLALKKGFVVFNAYPSIQCRLETYLAGALCNVDENIPISYSSKNQRGVCSRHSGNFLGPRPKCWYNPFDY